ncbi:NADP-dependent oxidoreductase domain-containing protein, partial [Mycena galopus ATCC 62051]
SPKNLRGAVKAAAEALASHKINVSYLHVPDRSVPFVDIAREVNELHKEGLIHEFGLSNFFSWEVSEFHFIAEKNEWIHPTGCITFWSVKQRRSRCALLPLLKKLGIRFYGYSPLSSGILAGKDLGVAAKDGSRFDTSNPATAWIAQHYTGRYAGLVHSAQELRDEAVKHGFSLPQVAFRWLKHHSKFEASKGDAIVIGAFTVERFQQTLWNEEGPLPAEIIRLVDDVCTKNKGPLVHCTGF